MDEKELDHSIVYEDETFEMIGDKSEDGFTFTFHSRTNGLQAAFVYQSMELYNNPKALLDLKDYIANKKSFISLPLCNEEVYLILSHYDKRHFLYAQIAKNAGFYKEDNYFTISKEVKEEYSEKLLEMIKEMDKHNKALLLMMEGLLPSIIKILASFEKQKKQRERIDEWIIVLALIVILALIMILTSR